MRRTPPAARLASLALVCAACAARAGARDAATPAADDPYAGPPAGAPAVPFGHGVLSDGSTFSAAFTPDGRTIFLARRGPGRSAPSLLTARFADGRWRAPVPVASVARYPAADPFLSRDGRRLYFSWQSPRPGSASDSAADYDSWMMTRTGDAPDAPWSAPVHLGAAPHAPQSDMYPSVTRDGTLYFDSVRPGLPGARNLWRARWRDGAYAAAEPLPAPVNDAGGATNPYVDPDERFVIFMSGRAGGHGRGDLWISYRTADGWGTPKNLGPRVNTPDVEFCPTLTPDGRYLVFSRIRYEGERQVADDLFIVAADVLPGP